MGTFKRLVASLAALATVFSVTAYAAESGTASASAPPTVAAQRAILINADTGRILYEKNDHQKMYPAILSRRTIAVSIFVILAGYIF